MTTESMDMTTETRILIGRDGGFIDNAVFGNRPHVFANTVNAKTGREFAMSAVRTGATEAEALEAFGKQFPQHEPQYVYTITRKLVQKPDPKDLKTAEEVGDAFKFTNGLKTILDNLERFPPSVAANPDKAPVEAPVETKPAPKPRKNPRRPKYAYQIVKDAMDLIRESNGSSFWLFDVEGRLASASLRFDGKMKTNTEADWQRALDVVTAIDSTYPTGGNGARSKEATLEMLSAALRKLR